MKAEVLQFLDLIISETREVKPRKKIHNERKRDVVSVCKQLARELNIPSDDPAEFVQYLNSNIRGLLGKNRNRTPRERICLSILMMVNEKLNPAYDHDFPIENLVYRLFNNRYDFIDTSNPYLVFLQDRIARQFQLQLCLRRSHELNLSQASVRFIIQLISLLLEEANYEPEKVSFRSIILLRDKYIALAQDNAFCGKDVVFKIDVLNQLYNLVYNFAPVPPLEEQVTFKTNENNWLDCLDKTPNAFTPTFKKRKLDKQEQTEVLLELFPELSLNMYSNLRQPD